VGCKPSPHLDSREEEPQVEEESGYHLRGQQERGSWSGGAKLRAPASHLNPPYGVRRSASPWVLCDPSDSSAATPEPVANGVTCRLIVIICGHVALSHFRRIWFSCVPPRAGLGKLASPHHAQRSGGCLAPASLQTGVASSSETGTRSTVSLRDWDLP
jgi:hypothetical protein